MLTVDGYLGQHLAGHESELTDTIRANAAVTVKQINLLLTLAAAAGVLPGTDPVTGTCQSSGWRPAGVNAGTANAAAHSPHLTGQGCDIRDTPDRALARWCLANQPAMKRSGLWMERPQWTPHWVHLQTRAPATGLRVFIPSSAPPMVPALPGESP